MIATPNTKIRLLKPFLILVVMVGALFCAPAVMADDTEDSSYAQAVVDNICTWYSLDRDDVNYIYTYTYRQGDNRIIVAVYPSDLQPSLRYGSGIYGDTFGMNFQFVNGYTWTDNDTAFGQYTDNGTAQIAGNIDGYNNFDLPHNFFGSFGSVSFVPYRNNQNLSEAEAVLYNTVLPPVETTEQTYSDMMLQQFLHENHLSVDTATAWLVSPSGQPTQIPISFTTPANYSGDIWIKCAPYTPYLDKFTPIVRDDVSLVDYAGYKISILYDFEVTDVSLYAVTDREFVQSLPAYPSINVSDTPHGDHASPFTNEHGYYSIQGVSYWGDLCTIHNAQNERTQLYCIWEFNPLPYAAIPRLVPLYVGLDVVTTDINGDTVISRDSNDYRQFVTNYNQNAVSGLTGTYSGSTFSKQDWRGQSVSQDVDYRNDFTITYDSNLGQVFRTIFSMGDGYILTLCIGGLSIAFAAYVLFGKH